MSSGSSLRNADTPYLLALMTAMKPAILEHSHPLHIWTETAGPGSGPPPTFFMCSACCSLMSVFVMFSEKTTPDILHWCQINRQRELLLLYDLRVNTAD